MKNWDRMSHEEREQFIREHADCIAVRVEVDGRWHSRFITELPPVLQITEIERLALRTSEPVRIKLGKKHV